MQNIIVAQGTKVNPVASYLGSLNSKKSRETMLYHLNMIARKVLQDESADAFGFPWHQLNNGQLMMIRAWLGAEYAPATANNYLSALRGILRQCWRDELMTHDAYQRASEIKNFAGSRDLAGREITADEIGKILDACRNDGIKGVRDSTIFVVLWSCGLRRDELSKLRLEDYQNGRLKVNGKGNKQRSVPVASSAQVRLDHWLEVRGDEPGFLFPVVLKGGNMKPERQFGDTGIHNMVSDRCKQAGVEDITIHDFRRTLISNLLSVNVDVITVSKIVGHSNVNTTKLYDRRADTVAADAVELIKIPV